MSQEIEKPTSEMWMAFLNGRLDEPQLQQLEEYLEKNGVPPEFAGMSGQVEDDSFLKKLRQTVQNESDRPKSVGLDVWQATLAETPHNSDVNKLLKTWPELLKSNIEIDPAKNVTIGHYRIIEKVSHSRMGQVYRCQDERSGDYVALKCPPQVLGERTLDRFRREIKVTQKLRHPQIVTIVDELQFRGLPVFVMPWVDGIDLGRLLTNEQCLSQQDVAEIGFQVAGILKYLKRNGVVHRDIKPSNLMLTATGELKLIDLGLALLHNSEIIDETYTESVQIIGSLDYLAPEQARDAHSADYRADIYSLGCTLCKLAIGKAPFEKPGERHALQKIMAHSLDPFPELHETNNAISSEFTTLLKRLCAKRPEDRPADLNEMAALFRTMAGGSNLQLLYQRNAGSNATENQNKTRAKLPHWLHGTRFQPTRRTIARAGILAAAGALGVSQRDRLAGAAGRLRDTIWNPTEYLFADRPQKWLHPHSVFIADGNLDSIHVIDYEKDFEVTRFKPIYPGWNIAVTRSGKLFISNSVGDIHRIDLRTNTGTVNENLMLYQGRDINMPEGSGGMLYVNAKSLYVTGMVSGLLYKIDTTKMEFDRSFGDGGYVKVAPAAFGIDHDPEGNLYVACESCVAKVSPDGKTVDRNFITGLKRTFDLGGFTFNYNSIFLIHENRVARYSHDGKLVNPEYIVWDQNIDHVLIDRELNLIYVSCYSYVDRVDVYKLNTRGILVRQIHQVGLNLAQMTLPVAD